MNKSTDARMPGVGQAVNSEWLVESCPSGRRLQRMLGVSYSAWKVQDLGVLGFRGKTAPPSQGSSGARRSSGWLHGEAVAHGRLVRLDTRIACPPRP